jgi:DNA-binding transcriptional ArsR family regulator
MNQKYDVVAFAENFGKGIGNNTRFKMLAMLARGPRTVGELAEHLEISQSTASQHLLVLKNGQLVHKEKRGQFVYYALDVDYMIAGLKGITEILESTTKKRSNK